MRRLYCLAHECATAARLSQVPYIEVPPASAKKAMQPAIYRGKGKKEAMIARARERGFDVGNDKASEHRADACAVWLWAVFEHTNEGHRFDPIFAQALSPGTSTA